MEIVTINHHKIGYVDYEIYTIDEAKKLKVKINDPIKPVEGEYIETEDGYALPVIRIYQTRRGILKRDKDNRILRDENGDKIYINNQIIRTPIGSYTIVRRKVHNCSYKNMKENSTGAIGRQSAVPKRVTTRHKRFMLEAIRVGNIYRAHKKIFKTNASKHRISVKFRELHKMYEKEKGDVVIMLIKEALEEMGVDTKKIAKELINLKESTESDSVKLSVLKMMIKIMEDKTSEALEPGKKKEFEGFKSEDLLRLSEGTAKKAQ